MKGRTSLVSALLVAIGLAVVLPRSASAGCGCAKPPPPRADVRPFVGYPDQAVVLFNDQLSQGTAYWVSFASSADGSVDWSRGRAMMRRDFADGQLRPQLRVAVGNVALGPCRIAVWTGDGRQQLFALGDDAFTVIAPPVVLHDFSETVVQDGYRGAVGRDGTLYIAVDVSGVSDATVFTGTANGFPLTFGAEGVSMYNRQGFLMQLLDPSSPGLFRIAAGGNGTSDTLSYWRHEFATYKQAHRRTDSFRTDDDPDWHADGTPHIDHNGIVVAIVGMLADGTRPGPGATAPFQLVISSAPAPASPLQ